MFIEGILLFSMQSEKANKNYIEFKLNELLCKHQYLYSKNKK